MVTYSREQIEFDVMMELADMQADIGKLPPEQRAEKIREYQERLRTEVQKRVDAEAARIRAEQEKREKVEADFREKVRNKVTAPNFLTDAEKKALREIADTSPIRELRIVWEIQRDDEGKVTTITPPHVTLTYQRTSKVSGTSGSGGSRGTECIVTFHSGEVRTFASGAEAKRELLGHDKSMNAKSIVSALGSLQNVKAVTCGDYKYPA